MTLLVACKNEDKSIHPATFTLESTNITRTEGNCDSQADRSNCVQIGLQYPVVKSGPESLRKNVATWTKDFLVSLLDPALELDDETSLSSALEGFIEIHKEMAANIPEHFSLDVSDTVLLQNAHHLTLRMDARSLKNGVHSHAAAAVATFDMKSGKHLRPVDLVNDLEKLYALAELKFRETRKTAFEAGFDFSENWPFVIAQNVGLTTEGLFFCYVPYEVAPYSMGYTEFVIPYDVLEKL